MIRRAVFCVSSLACGAAAAEQSSGIESLALGAEVAVDVRILHLPVDAGRTDARQCHRPHAELPIAHMHGDHQRRPHFVLVAADPMPVGGVQPVGLLQDAVDIHGLNHDPPEIFPRGARDALPLLGGLVGKGVFEIGKRTVVPAAVIGSDQAPSLG